MNEPQDILEKLQNIVSDDPLSAFKRKIEEANKKIQEDL